VLVHISYICLFPYFSLAFNWLDGLYFVIVIPICIPKLELWDEEKYIVENNKILPTTK